MPPFMHPSPHLPMVSLSVCIGAIGVLTVRGSLRSLAVCSHHCVPLLLCAPMLPLLLCHWRVMLCYWYVLLLHGGFCAGPCNEF